MADRHVIIKCGELYHHGIEGQKWGIRRYQNADGTLTEEGKKRYYKNQDSADRKKKLDDLNQRITDKYAPLYEKVNRDYPYKLGSKNTEHWKAWREVFEAEQKELAAAKDEYVKEVFTEEGQKIFALANTALKKAWSIWQQSRDSKDSIGQLQINELLTGFEAAVYAFPEFELEDVYHSDEFLEIAWMNLADMEAMKLEGEKFISNYLQ